MDTNSKYLENGRKTVQPVPISGIEHEIINISRCVNNTNSLNMLYPAVVLSAWNKAAPTVMVSVKFHIWSFVETF